MHFESEPEGWISSKEFEELCQLYRNNELDAENFIGKVYENFKKIRGRDPDLETSFRVIKQMDREKAIMYMTRCLIRTSGRKSEYSKKKAITRSRAKCPDEVEFERLSRELYGGGDKPK